MAKLRKSHNVTIGNDKTVNMVQLPSAEPPEATVIETFARLSTINSNTKVDQISNNTNDNLSPNNMPLPNNQSSIIVDQFSQLTEELKNFTNFVTSNLSEIPQTCQTTQEQTGKFIENAISQVLTKNQNTTVPTSATLNNNTPNIKYESPPYNLHPTPTQHTDHPNMIHAQNCTMHTAYSYQTPHTI